MGTLLQQHASSGCRGVARCAQRGQSALARRSPLQPPTAPDAHPLCSGLPSGPERKGTLAWLPKRGCGGALVRASTSPTPPPLAMQVSAALRWREQRATAARLWNVRRDSHGGLMAQRVRAGLTGRAGPSQDEKCVYGSTVSICGQNLLWCPAVKRLAHSLVEVVGLIELPACRQNAERFRVFRVS